MFDADTMIEDDEKTLSELLQEYCEEERIHHFEGARGVRSLEKITKALGYDDRFAGTIDNFLQDNPGAQQALYDWIADQDLPEWRECIISELPEQDDESLD